MPDSNDPPAAPPVGWYLKHHDGVQHGPFPWEKIVLGAQQKKLHPLTQIMHPERTAAQWVQVSQLDALAVHLDEIPAAPQASGAAHNVEPSRASQTTPTAMQTVHVESVDNNVRIRTRKSKKKKSSATAAWLLQVLMFLAPTTAVMGLVVYQLGTDRLKALFSPQVAKSVTEPVNADLPTAPQTIEPSQNDTSRQSVTPTPRAPNTPDQTRKTPPNASPHAPQTAPNQTANVEPEDRSPEPNSNDSEKRERLREFARLANEDDPGDPAPDANVVLGDLFHVPLKMNRDRFTYEIPSNVLQQTDIESPKFQVVDIERTSGTVTSLPSSRRLTLDEPTRLAVSNMPTFGVELKLVRGKTSDQTLNLLVDMRFRPSGPEPVGFTRERVERSANFLAKQANTTQIQLNALQTERKSRQNYVKSKQLKPLDLVKAAKNRIVVLDQLLASTTQTFEAQKHTLNQLAELNKIAEAIASGPGLTMRPIR